MKKCKSVLLVDDNELDLFIGKAIIELSGITENIVTAKNGMDALNKMGEYYLNNKLLPELIFADIVMPIMGGIKLIEEIIRFPGYSRGNCKIIVLTASLYRDEDRERIKSLGVKDILLKPLDKTELMEILSSENKC